MDLGLADRVFIVTGGTGGLGMATARELVAEGAKVVVSGVHEKSAEDAVATLGGAERAVGVTADNTDAATPERLMQVAHDAFGRLDGALLSVGAPPSGSADAITDDQWRASFESTFLGTIRLSRAIAGKLGDGGVIGFVLSTSVYEPIPNLTISNTFRPGLAGYAKSLSDELGPRGIRVFGLVPAHVDTDRARQLYGDRSHPSPERTREISTIPLRRFAEPKEFGQSAAFMLSPAASYITGMMLTVDGGARHGF
jgi:3-oxoacyl-[acyl-carrier protein] reductase